MDIPSKANAQALRILRMRELQERTGVSKSFIYQLIGQDRFPKSVRLGERSVGWFEHEINDWLANRADASAK